MAYSEFMAKYIFAPLGMTNTFVYDPARGLPGNAAVSYRYNWTREPDMFADGVTGDKGIFSTVQDMFRWDQSFYNRTLLSNESIELSYGPCSFEKPGVKNYGLGWRMLCYPNGNKIIYHNGWWHGNNTSFYRLIKENMTIVVLGNKFNKNIYRQAPVIYSIVKGVEVGSGFDDEG
jgi:CubicO group peptidase (beta-lactamase class C family)